MQATNTRPRFEVVADGQGICSHVGAALLGELSDRLGLTGELGRRANRGVRAGAYDRGQVLRDLVVMLTDGGDCVSDLATLRDQPELFGVVCSTPTAWRILAEEVGADPRGIAGLWSALARVREHAWALGAAPTGPLTLDFDAGLVEAHSDKQGAAPTYKPGFGFHPLGCWLDRGDGTGEALAGILRPGNAGSNTAQDHIDVLAMALLACPNRPAASRSWCGPTPPARPTPSSTTWSVASCGSRSGSTSPSRSARPSSPSPSPPGSPPWTPTAAPVTAPGSPSWRAWTLPARLAAGHPGDLPSRAAPPGAAHKMAITDPDGHRFQVFITNQPDPDPVVLEARDRPHAHVEDRIRGAKASGLRNLPFFDFGANDAWLTLVMIAQTLVCWAQALLLDGDCKVAESKTLRYHLRHTAGRVVRHARRVIVRIERTWPWADQLVTAFGRLRVLPVRC